MATSLFFITGTDTGAGKTVVTCLLARALRATGRRVAALKPLCSGGRADAIALRRAAGGELRLDEVNPWHFRAALAPELAARAERRTVTRREVLGHIRAIRHRWDVVLVEGAGGLLSPLGVDFDARDLIGALRATPVVVCPNRLGAINQVLLVLDALPPAARRRARVALVTPQRPDHAAAGNTRWLRTRLGAARVWDVPWLSAAERAGRLVRALAPACPLR